MHEPKSQAMYDRNAQGLQSFASAIEACDDVPSPDFTEALRRLNCAYARRCFHGRPSIEPDPADAALA